MVTFRERLFADDYAAGGQLAWIPESSTSLIPKPDDPPWRLPYLGSLRFDSLLSRRLVIPDSHLLDGRFFLSVSASDLRQELGRPTHGSTDDGLRLPIVLRLRRATLNQTVAEFLRTDREQLNGFSFKAIPSLEARRQLAQELKQHTWGELERRLGRESDSAAAVGELLKDCLRNRGFEDKAGEWVSPLVERWQSWLDLERKGALEIETYSWGAFPLAEALAAEGIADTELRPFGRQAFSAVRMLVDGDSKLHSQADELMDRLKAEATGETQVAELNRINQVYSRVRYRAIAWQHQAVFVRKRRDGPSLGISERLLEEAEGVLDQSVVQRIELPDDVTQSLGELSPQEFRLYLRQNQETLTKWRSEGSINALKTAVANLTDFIVPPKRLPPEGLTLMMGASLTFGATTLLEKAVSDPTLSAASALAGGYATILATTANKVQRHRMRRRLADIVSSLGSS